MSETKKKQPKDRKEYLVTRYELREPSTEKQKDLAKRLSNSETKTQAAMLYRFVAKSKEPPTFAEILAFARGELKGKNAETVEANWRWYVNELKKKGLVKAAKS